MGRPAEESCAPVYDAVAPVRDHSHNLGGGLRQHPELWARVGARTAIERAPLCVHRRSACRSNEVDHVVTVGSVPAT
jgi:hypothetical protein